MLSYQHVYHAGNFADVHKHAVLLDAFKALKLKPLPLDVLDTHAGRGIYDLTSDEARKNAEFVNGAGYVWAQFQAKSKLEQESHALKDYVRRIAAHNPGSELKQYPGTAMIAADMLDKADRITTSEKHPGEFALLQANMPKNATLRQEDGLGLLSGLDAPAAGRRRVVVIDPSYEIKTDYQAVPQAIIKAYNKSPQGCYILWYPLMANGAHRDMMTILRKASVKDVLVSELRLQTPPQEGYRMTGSGMAVINPPWPEHHLRRLTEVISGSLPIKAFADTFWLDNVKINPETERVTL
jgi:23S rRNA (adenine2030-N6)-methyltransferase